MVQPTRKPPLWAIAFFALAGAATLTFGIIGFATDNPAELSEWSTGRALSLPGWAWNTLNLILGVFFLSFTVWAYRWRRRF